MNISLQKNVIKMIIIYLLARLNHMKLIRMFAMNKSIETIFDI